jgi:hypothetical protein
VLVAGTAAVGDATATTVGAGGTGLAVTATAAVGGTVGVAAGAGVVSHAARLNPIKNSPAPTARPRSSIGSILLKWHGGNSRALALYRRTGHSVNF